MPQLASGPHALEGSQHLLENSRAIRHAIGINGGPDRHLIQLLNDLPIGCLPGDDLPPHDLKYPRRLFILRPQGDDTGIGPVTLHQQGVTRWGEWIVPPLNPV